MVGRSDEEAALSSVMRAEVSVMKNICKGVTGEECKESRVGKRGMRWRSMRKERRPAACPRFVSPGPHVIGQRIWKVLHFFFLSSGQFNSHLTLEVSNPS